MPDSSDSSSKRREALTAKSSELCLACGLCCRGVFFVNTIDPKDYGVDLPGRTNTRGSTTPPGCLLHVDNKCMIYDHSLKPSFCGDWQCRLLKQLMDDVVTLESAKRIIAEIVRLYEKIAKSLLLDGSKPVLKLAIEAWENRNEEMFSGRLSGDQILDIASFLRLVDHYLKPYKPGLFLNGRRPPRG